MLALAMKTRPRSFVAMNSREGPAELSSPEAGGGGVGLQPGIVVGSGESKRDMPVPWGWDMVDGVP